MLCCFESAARCYQHDVWDSQKKVLGSPDKHRVICHELNPKLLFHPSYAFVPISHMSLGEVKCGVDWCGEAGRQDAMLLYPVWKFVVHIEGEWDVGRN